MTATDELRSLLDERGVKYETKDDRMGACETRWCESHAIQLTPTANLIMIVTPEQAIAATLGRSTLTAHDVWEAIGNHGVSQLQAIADELNAKLCGGECEMDAHGNCTACGEFVAKSWEHVRRFDGGYEGARDTSRYGELFGTPERAARTLQDMCDGSENCKDLRCPALQDTEAECGNYKLLLEWLRGDAE